MRLLGFVMLMFLSFHQAQCQDWPELSRYIMENKGLRNLDTGEYRVVFMGNSITEGWKNADPDLFKRPGFINRGISSQTTPQMLLRFRQDVIDLQPRVVILLAGTNDIAGNTGPMTLDQIRDNIISMVELSKANNIEVVLCSVLPAYDYNWRPGLQPNIKIPKLNEMLREYSKVAGIHYLDYFSEMADERNGLPKELAADGVHPTRMGYDIMKRMLLDTLEGL